MIYLLLLIVFGIYLFINIILTFITYKYGKFSYDGFSALGFKYYAPENVFYATKNAWQKQFGYTHMYDVASPIFQMILDTEPIKFFYNDKHWLLTFWKGQYGITTGAEIGIYNTSDKIITRHTLYHPLSDTELLTMSYSLYQNGNLLFSATTTHWWLAVFKLGHFANPKDLTLDISITFPSLEMLTAFLNGFIALGYTSADFQVKDHTFTFSYKTPKSKQVWTRGKVADYFRQSINRHNVKLYQKHLATYIETNYQDDRENPDAKLIFVSNMLPEALKNDKQEGDA